MAAMLAAEGEATPDSTRTTSTGEISEKCDTIQGMVRDDNTTEAERRRDLTSERDSFGKKDPAFVRRVWARSLCLPSL